MTIYGSSRELTFYSAWTLQRLPVYDPPLPTQMSPHWHLPRPPFYVNNASLVTDLWNLELTSSSFGPLLKSGPPLECDMPRFSDAGGAWGNPQLRLDNVSHFPAPPMLRISEVRTVQRTESNHLIICTQKTQGRAGNHNRHSYFGAEMRTVGIAFALVLVLACSNAQIIDDSDLQTIISGKQALRRSSIRGQQAGPRIMICLGASNPFLWLLAYPD